MPVPTPAALPIVAAFDVDGTLTSRDCVVPFLRRDRGTLRLAAGLVRRAGRLVPAVARRDRDAVKAVAAEAAFAGRPIEEIERTAAPFAAHVHRDWLRAGTLATLRDHRTHGRAVVLVSASFGVYLRPLAALLDLDPAHVVATELEVDAAGRCTGQLLGGNCRGDAKVTRLHEWLDRSAGGRRAVELWAYGDSPGDAAMLADADRAIWVTER